MFKFLLILAFIGNCYAEPIKIIGRTTKSKYIVGEISSDDYVKTLIMLREGLDTQVVTNLDTYQDKGTKWKLKKFSIGLGVTGEIGIGPYQFGKALKQRFVYSR